MANENLRVRPAMVVKPETQQNMSPEPGVMAYAWNLSTQEVEAGGL
jgi:hypothetical protein